MRRQAPKDFPFGRRFLLSFSLISGDGWRMALKTSGVFWGEESRNIMVGSVHTGVISAFRRKKRAALPLCLFATSLGMLVTAFVAPAPALDAPRTAARAESQPLPMFKDPRAALRAGLESYHAGDAATSLAALRYAAEGGEPLAKWKLGRMYAEGDGVVRDDAKAYEYFAQIVDHYADDEPDPRERSMAASAFVAVGIYLRDGVPSGKIKPDLDRAFDLFRYAATYFSNADAQYNLARMYLEGTGVKKNVRQGVNWLELAARKGHPQAQAMLGRMMFTGEASGEPERARGLMFLTLARDAAGGATRDQWIADLHAEALNSASDADRSAAVTMLEGYLRERN